MSNLLNSLEALQRLKEGNQRFISGKSQLTERMHGQKPVDFVAGQTPFAVILGCSDSRVPAELVFDQGLGDLFVIRVAGNIVAPSQIGSIEFAVEQFDTALVIVLGHTHCGAVEATIQALKEPEQRSNGHQHRIVERIMPAISTLLETPLCQNHDELMKYAVKANIRASVNQVARGSSIIEGLVEQGKLMIVGAEYCLASGEVDFFEKEAIWLR